MSHINSTSIVPELPVELIEKILENLRDDKHTLVSCSLVSRFFHSCTCRHLFRTISVKGWRDSLLRLKNLTDSPHITKRVESYLLSSCIHPSYLSQAGLLLVSMISLTDLQMTNISITSLEWLRTLIVRLPRLKSLTIASVLVKHEEDLLVSSDSISFDGPRIERLHINYPRLTTNAQSFFRSALLPQYRSIFLEPLQELHIQMYYLDHTFVSLCRDLIQAATMVKSLDIAGDCSNSLSPWPSIQPIILPINLQFFAFDLHFASNHTHLSAMRWFADALFSGPCESIEQLHIMISFDSVSLLLRAHETWTHFGQLDRRLSAATTFHCLQITYRCHQCLVPEGKSRLLSCTWEAFAFLQERSALRIKIHGDSS